MRKIALLLLLSWVFATAQAQLQTEQRTIIWPEQSEQGDMSIEPGTSFVQRVGFTPRDYPVRRTLRIVGGGVMPGSFAARGETFFREQEYFIDDNLDSLDVFRDLHSLYFHGEGEDFERHAYNRLTLPEGAAREITIEVAHKRRNLKVAQGGDFGVELQVYKCKEGRHPDDVYDKADTVIYIPVPEGSGGWRVMRRSVTLPANTASILIRVGGTNFSGECRVEAPRVIVGNKTLFHSPFIQNARRGDGHNYWVGINMATRSWPRWRLEFGGKTIFEGNVFDRASNIADFYIPLPDNIAGEGELKLTLVPEPHRTPFAYRLRSVQLLEESAREVEIVSVPKFLARGKNSAVLLEINAPTAQITIEAGDGIEVLEPHLTAPPKGLHAVEIRAVVTGRDIPVTVRCGDGQTLTANIAQVVEKQPDGVYISSGDEVHIDKTEKDYDRFFKWYVSARVGNWYQFRPSYQWSGVRHTSDDFVRQYTGLLNKLNMPYAWQVEGRTLAASRINPSLESLQSPMFRGKQAHENDGGYYYWQHFKYQGLHSDMAARTRPFGGIFAKHRPIYTDHGTFIHYDPRGAKDMADGARRFVANLAYSRGESTRHTGPSTMFRYFYQAGYEWLGAEQMYGPEDIIMSSLRGASRAYGKSDFGSLHAVQWGSQPFTDPLHSLRFYLSLAVAYIHGSSHINTEEGLWTDEYANDRFIEAGKQHMRAQHLMLDYIETHSRRGEITTPIAVIQGRNDAWKSFGRTSLWSQEGDKWSFNKAVESFDLLKIFYPDSNVGYAATDGLFTATPYGPIDLLPIEASNEVMSRYKALIFLGWNSFEGADFVRVGKFVERGGTVILTAAHLNAGLQPAEPARFPEDDTVIRTLLGEKYRSLRDRTVIPHGAGRFIYYPQGVYPADGTIREDYTADIRAVAGELTAAERAGRGWIDSSPHIDFAVWDDAGMRTFYLLNIDWKSGATAHPATLRIGGSEFTLDVPTYTLATIRSARGIAAMVSGNTSDVLSIENRNGELWVTCQTTGPDTITIFSSITGRQTAIPIASAGITAIAFDPDKQ